MSEVTPFSKICRYPAEVCICRNLEPNGVNQQRQPHDPRLARAAKNRRVSTWFRFFVPLDGTALGLEMKIEASGQVSKLRVAEQQPASLDEKPRLKVMLVGSAWNRLALINLMLEELDMPWEVLRGFRHSAGVVGAVIEAADNRLLELGREWREQSNDCA